MFRTSKSARSDFANRIRTLRTEKSLTSSALAKIAGVSPAAIWQWEHAGVVPRKPTLAKLAMTLRVSENFLLTGAASEDDNIRAPSITPSTSPTAHLDEFLLEDLIRAIETKGFVVTLRSKDH